MKNEIERLQVENRRLLIERDYDKYEIKSLREQRLVLEVERTDLTKSVTELESDIRYLKQDLEYEKSNFSIEDQLKNQRKKSTDKKR